MNTTTMPCDATQTPHHAGLTIILGENGYNVYDEREKTSVIEGIKSWEAACELHEMLAGERSG
ncbi:MAG: hypothetical protein HQL53_08835 [Magnetococcales bacterium]|nr:hypothetical protein [Magnetococcales bacterium]